MTLKRPSLVPVSFSPSFVKRLLPGKTGGRDFQLRCWIELGLSRVKWTLMWTLSRSKSEALQMASP